MPEEPRYISLCERSLNDHGDRNIAIVVAIFMIACFVLYGFARVSEAHEWQRCQQCLLEP